MGVCLVDPLCLAIAAILKQQIGNQMHNPLLPPAHRRALSITELADSFGVSVPTIYREIQAGRLRKSKLGKKTIFMMEDVVAWADSMSEPRANRRH